jgi:hypothetical protein
VVPSDYRKEVFAGISRRDGERTSMPASARTRPRDDGCALERLAHRSVDCRPHLEAGVHPRRRSGVEVRSALDPPEAVVHRRPNPALLRCARAESTRPLP